MTGKLSSRARLEIARSRRLLLLAPPGPYDDRQSLADRAQALVHVEAEIHELELEVGELFRLPHRADIDE